ncbi:MAG: hypothetical protein IPM82_29225 [Saprospiraceae bacterium]|nr:hypothetical protein [Saprospiraceae bacterium]
MAKPVSNTVKQHPSTYLSGIALMFLDTADTADELLVTGGSDLVIWHDNIGKSTKVTFIVPDRQFIGKLELMFFDSKCTAKIWWQDRSSGVIEHANGDLLVDEKDCSLYFSVTGKAEKLFSDIFYPLNVQLMQLHTRQIRKVAVKSWYNKDSINVIVGADSQFDTDFELFWLDQSLRNRLRTVASNSYSKLFLFSNAVPSLQDSVVGNSKLVHHQVERQKNGVRGTITITMKPDGSARYIFLKPFHNYRMFIDYSFSLAQNKQGELSINRLGLRDMDTGDFVDMNLYDFVDNGLPVMYVDLIQGVVTSADPWDIANVIHAIEDVVAATMLPQE